MKNIFREYLNTQKQLVEISNELQETKNLLNYSLEENEELEKEIKSLKQKFIDTLEEIEKPLYENTYNHLEVKVRKVTEIIKDYKKELEV